MELEAEVAKLKEENQELQKKQVSFGYASCHLIYRCKHTCIRICVMFALKFSLIDIYFGIAG